MKNLLSLLLFGLLSLTTNQAWSLSYEAHQYRILDTIADQNQSVAEQDSLQIITVKRNAEIDALVDYYSKEDPPAITLHPGKHFRSLPGGAPLYNYYQIGDVRVTRNVVEQYLGEVSPVAYKDYSRGRHLARKSGQWLYAGLGGYLLALTSSNRTIRRVGLATLAVGATISLGTAIAGDKKRRRGVAYYNTNFR